MTPENFLASKQVTLPTPHGCVELVRMKDALEAVRMTKDSIKHHEDPKIFMVEQNETGDLELNEFENAILEILDFTARSVLANHRMPKFRRLQQLSKEWSVNILDVAKKVIEDEIKAEE